MSNSWYFVAAIVLLAGCATSQPLVTTSSDAGARLIANRAVVGPNGLAELPVGRWCTISFTDQLSVYEGRIVRATADEVVLTDGWGRTTTRAPRIVNGIPYLRRMFTNTGVGRIEGQQSFKRAHIANVVLFDPEESEKRIAAAAAFERPQIAPETPHSDDSHDEPAATEDEPRAVP